MESILASTKKLANLGEDYEAFDSDIIMYMNGVFLTLKQLGVGPKNGFVVKDHKTLWSDFIPENEVLRESVKVYMGAKVRLQFDPPLSTALLEALKEIVKEYECRLNYEVETP